MFLPHSQVSAGDELELDRILVSVEDGIPLFDGLANLESFSDSYTGFNSIISADKRSKNHAATCNPFSEAMETDHRGGDFKYRTITSRIAH